ncbi:MAG: anti-sigma factor [Planctomycetota bacterium]|nr:anti-sigma factor [Planctomycetota bacterium]
MMRVADFDRREELLIGRALDGLSESEARELDALLGGREDHSYDITAARLELACLKEVISMPVTARLRVERAAQEWLENLEAPTASTAPVAATAPTAATRATPTRSEELRGPAPLRLADAPADRSLPPVTKAPANRSSFRTVLVGLAMAAALSFAAFVGYQQLSERSPASQRERMLASGLDAMQWAPWTETAVSYSKDVRGDVVWDERTQSGYMTFRNLPPSDPTSFCYQLWIIDASREGEPPVDGGVFHVPAGATEVIVPFHPRVKVKSAAAFAITVEKPEGVVVSKQDRRVVVAAPPAKSG